MSRTTSLPRSFHSRSLKVIRPRDARDVYSHPGAEFQRLARIGALLPLAHGYYAIPDAQWVGNRDWRPSPEGMALGIAQADHGQDGAALSGISAARLLNAVPRALATGVVSVPVHRRRLHTVTVPIHFWRRDIESLDVQRHVTDLAEGWTTTAEQTLVDLADRPALGGASSLTVSEAIWVLAARSNWVLVEELCVRQRKRAAYARARWVADAVVTDAAVTPRGRLVSALDLTPAEPTPRRPFGILDDPEQ